MPIECGPGRLAQQHDTLNHNTRAQFKQVFDALRGLMAPPDPPDPPKRPIGFVEQQEKPSISKASAKAPRKKP